MKPAIKINPTNKAELSVYVKSLKDELLSGNYDMLQVAGLSKSMEETAKQLKADVDIKDAIMEEAAKYPDKTIDLDKFKLTKKDAVTYDYSQCGDQVYNQMVEDKDQLDEQIKARKEMLKTGVDPSTGETFDKPLKKSTSTISVSLK